MFSADSCRVCLSETANLTSTLKTEGDTNLNDLLSYCVPEVNWIDNSLSSLICTQCIEELNLSVRFRRKCIETYRLRRDYLLKQLAEKPNLDEKSSEETCTGALTNSKQKRPYECIQCYKSFLSVNSYKIHYGKAHKDKRKKCSLRLSERIQNFATVSLSNDVTQQLIENINENAKIKLELGISNIDQEHKEVVDENKLEIEIKNNDDPESDNDISNNSGSDFCDENLDICDEDKKGIGSKFSLQPASTIRKYFPSKREKKCKICCKEFTKTTTLQNHFRSVHSFENCFKCKYCDQAFPNKERLIRHENHHTGNRKYVCSICGKKFFTSSDLFHHNERHAGDRKFKCDICNVKSFTTRNNLRTHKKIVHTNPEEWKFLCTHCGRKCVTQGALNAHMKRHGDRKDFPCNLCEKGFCTKAELVKHLKAHSDQREFKCEICGQQYKLKEILERHLFRKHGIGDKIFPERIKKHPCPVCPLKFCSKLQLEKHLRSHNGERPFKCEYCDHSFICRSYLKGHIKTKHPTYFPKEPIQPLSTSEVLNNI